MAPAIPDRERLINGQGVGLTLGAKPRVKSARGLVLDHRHEPLNAIGGRGNISGVVEGWSSRADVTRKPP